MSKELEAFSKEKQALDELYDVAGNIKNLKDDYMILKTALQRLESIDNANPSEALEDLKYIGENFYIEIGSAEEDCTVYAKNFNGYDIIKQALLKAQEPKHYLKWEDLEFKEEGQDMDVLLNGKPYTLYFYKLATNTEVNISAIDMHIVTLNSNYKEDVQFFNDLHLERVEE